MRAFFVGLAFLLGTLFLSIAIVLLLEKRSENEYFSSLDCKVVQITNKELLTYKVDGFKRLEAEESIIYYKHDGMLFGLSAIDENEFALFDVIKIGDFIEACTSNEIRIIKKIDAVSI